jgi:hypothetical protein
MNQTELELVAQLGQISKNQAEHTLKKFTEFNDAYRHILRSEFPLTIEQFSNYSDLIVGTTSAIRIILAIFVVLGSRLACQILVYAVYPLRIAFYHNPFS